MGERIRSYCGRIEVAEGDFELVAERFIPSPEGVSFRFIGLDESGGFSAEGLARTNGGMLVAGNVPVRYTHYASGRDYATISFTSVQEMHGQAECHVLGIWVQGGGTGSFKAVLRP